MGLEIRAKIRSAIVGEREQVSPRSKERVFFILRLRRNRHEHSTFLELPVFPSLLYECDVLGGIYPYPVWGTD